MKLHNIYNPITAAPFLHNDTYVEIAPCEELKPFVKCFWGSISPYHKSKAQKKQSHLVIPDTCMDLIITIDYSNNNIHDLFCGIDDKTHLVKLRKADNIISTFAIRFYPWSAYLFTEDSLKNTKNTRSDLEQHFSRFKREVEPLFFDVVNINERICIAQKYLLKHIHLQRTNHLIMNYSSELIKKKGNIEIRSLPKDLGLSIRQLERVFAENLGVTPKKLSSLIKYQYLWQDILYHPNFNILDAVFQFGYTDQSHLMHEFKRYHSLTISEAKNLAFSHVVFLQDKN